MDVSLVILWSWAWEGSRAVYLPYAISYSNMFAFCLWHVSLYIVYIFGHRKTSCASSILCISWSNIYIYMRILILDCYTSVLWLLWIQVVFETVARFAWLLALLRPAKQLNTIMHTYFIDGFRTICANNTI